MMSAMECTKWQLASKRDTEKQRERERERAGKRLVLARHCAHVKGVISLPASLSLSLSLSLGVCVLLCGPLGWPVCVASLSSTLMTHSLLFLSVCIIAVVINI